MRKRNTKNEIQIRFQSDEKTKNKTRISNPLLKVRRKRKTKNEIQIRFSVSQVEIKRKIEMEIEFHFRRPKKNEK